MNRMRFVLALLLALALLAACAPEDKPTDASQKSAAPTPAQTQDARPVIGLSLRENAGFEQRMAAHAEELAQQAGFRLLVAFAGGDADRQQSDIRAMLDEDVQALIVNPVDVDNLLELMDEYALKNKKTVNVLSQINGRVDCLIAPDYAQIGAKGARLSAEAAKDNDLEAAKVFLLEGEIDSMEMQLMHDGFVREAEKEERITVLGSSHIPEKITAPDGANVFFAHSGALAEMADSGHIIAVDGSRATLEKVKSGAYYAAVFFGPEELAEKAMAQAVAAAGGADIPQYVELSIGVASASTVDAYLAEGGEYAEVAEKGQAAAPETPKAS